MTDFVIGVLFAAVIILTVWVIGMNDEIKAMRADIERLCHWRETDQASFWKPANKDTE